MLLGVCRSVFVVFSRFLFCIVLENVVLLFCSVVMVVRVGFIVLRLYMNGVGVVSDFELKIICWVSGLNDLLSVIVIGLNGVGRLVG